MNNITYAVSVDVNNPIIPYNVYVANVLDSNVRYLEITLYQNGNVIALSNEAIATASLVTDDVLIDDSVKCTISNNIISVPLEDLQRHGNLDVQVTVTEGEKVLAIPFPIQVRVTPNIAEDAQIDEDSLGSYAEVVQEIAAARKGYDSLDERLNSIISGDEHGAVVSGMERIMNKVQSIGSQSQTGDNDKYPSVTAVRDYVNIKTDDLQDYIEGELDRIDDDISGINTALLGKANKAAAGSAGELAALDGNGSPIRSGVSVIQSIGEGSNSRVPTTKAVRNALNDAISAKQDKPQTAGTAGQVLALDDNLNPVWANQSTDYAQLSNKPTINNVELSGNKTLAALGINAGSVGFDETGTYTDGSVGKELSDQKNAFNTITDETKLLADGYGVIPSEMVHGSGSSQNGSVASPYNYRVTSKDIVSFDRDVTLKSKTGFVFNLYFFTAQGAYDRFVQNQTSYSLANNKKVRITIKRSTEDTSEVADIPLFASSVYYEGEPLQRINNFVVDEEYTDFSGGYISTNTTPVNLTPTPSSSYKCVVVDCSEGDAFQVTGSGSVSNTVFAFLNSSGTVITKPSADISIHDLELVAPANTAKAVFNFRTSYDIKLVKNPASYIADKTNRNNEARIENTAFCFSNDDNLIENTKMVGGYLNSESGDVRASATYYTTDYIFVPKDKTIRFEPRIRKFLAYDYPSAPIAGSFVDLTTQGAYEYTATHDCYVRVTIAKEYVGITQAKILPFIVDSAVIGANDLIEFATIQNIKKCTFSKSGRELTVATSENDTYCCVDILTNAFEADNLYYFDIDIKTATGSGKALRVLFLGTESNQNNTYSGVRTDHVSAGDKIKVFACAKKGCRGIRLFITGGTPGDATFVFNHLSIYKVLKINEPEKKKERRFMQPKARVSIMDDDGYVTFYQYLLPMIRTYGIPIATAYQGDNGYEHRDLLMTREQLHEVEEAGGEIIAHGYNSLINLGSEAEADIILSKKMLNASGFFPTVYVYPYGDNNQNIRQLVEKYFDCSFKVATPYPPDYRTEAGCVPMFRLNRCHCGGENYDVPVTTGRYANLDTASMDYFEALIQECIARKSWLVLYTHSWQMEEGQQPTGYDNQFDLMEAIIKRILELKESGTDIDIIKFEDGIEMFGNAFQAGDYLGQSNNDLTLHTNPGCAISKQGLYDFPAGNNMTPST